MPMEIELLQVWQLQAKKKKLKKKKKDKNRKQNPRNSHLSVLIGFIYFKLPYLV